MIKKLLCIISLMTCSVYPMDLLKRLIGKKEKLAWDQKLKDDLKNSPHLVVRRCLAGKMNKQEKTLFIQLGKEDKYKDNIVSYLDNLDREFQYRMDKARKKRKKCENDLCTGLVIETLCSEYDFKDTRGDYEWRKNCPGSPNAGAECMKCTSLCIPACFIMLCGGFLSTLDPVWGETASKLFFAGTGIGLCACVSCHQKYKYNEEQALKKFTKILRLKNLLNKK